MKNIVSLQELFDSLEKPDVVVVDCRFVMGQPNAGREQYEASHIPGAVYLDLEQDLSGPVDEHGGRHPLPDIVDLTMALSRVGIGNDSRVIAYDDQGGAMASRLWWLLNYLGHKEAAVLDEGFAAWVKAGYSVTSEVEAVQPAKFLAVVEHSILMEMDELRERLKDESLTLIDSREAPRYRGEVEPLDRVAGHIPGAINRFWKDGLTADGSWKDAEAQAERFADLDKDGEIVVYCGSGVTATPNVIALQEAGFTKVRLYAGSWSDWISYSENPVATGEE
ncbi:3-mercaptopyruvate sulfurtransferase [Paenibacillus oryzae]|uniref:3-mercaptopyruvate sulfurtransferase n=1 Tax=Paenibacillus oryzae TaxID=1844972 RepID=A0A1A5YAS1_9BACL|nr:sulfurtransferase [Paenibacillus oryzae]OBR62475.1 3-mercaptopyruvate sulfurtransferase [Paenibacillus oryzae]